MGTRRLGWVWGPVLLTALVVMGGAAEAATRNVAGNGVDDGACGSMASPCRSISQAIANATPGDTILVGPGRYDASSGIVVDKRLEILSSHGAAATVLDASGAMVDAVRIGADRVVFGKPKKGFTITGANGVYGGLSVFGAARVHVAGNVARDNPSSGFYVNDGTEHVLSGNAAWGNGASGIVVGGSNSVVSGNAAWNNGWNCAGCAGFILSGSGHLVVGNASSSNRESGFQLLDAGHVLRGNLASANGSWGFRVEGFGSGFVLSGNAASGNQEAGVYVGIGSNATISRNDLYDNGTGTTATFPNCGLANESGAAIDAPDNFWGAAGGPGSDPADDACNAGGGSTTAPDPVATKPFKIKSKPLF